MEFSYLEWTIENQRKEIYIETGAVQGDTRWKKLFPHKVFSEKIG